MSSEGDSIQDLGGAELARHYPDRGPLAGAGGYRAVLQTEPRVEGFLSWLRSVTIHCNSFLAVLSADAEGLRVRVALDEFAVFIPWAEASVSAERAWPATVVSLRTAAVPSLTLIMNLDDEAADDLFGSAGLALPRRHPPRSLNWDLANGWVALVLVAAAVSAGLVGALLVRG